MNNTEQEQTLYTVELTEMEAYYLNSAVVEFFHKTRAAVESETVVAYLDERYNTAKSLWAKIEKIIPVIGNVK
jgi:hypothetical protein